MINLTRTTINHAAKLIKEIETKGPTVVSVNKHDDESFTVYALVCDPVTDDVIDTYYRAEFKDADRVECKTVARSDHWAD